jgi:ketosteroid isomerase-like protein
MTTVREGGKSGMSAASSGITEKLSTAYVHGIFKRLESGDGRGFFDDVADEVDWIVEGTHPLAGRGFVRGTGNRQWRVGGGRAAFWRHGQERAQV